MRSSLLAISLAISSMVPVAAQEQPATTTKQGAGKDAPERLKITIRVIPSMVKFDTTHFEVNTGSAVELRFENGCIMPHNLVLIQPSAENALIAGVNALGAEGMQKHFVPDVPGILASSRLLQPQSSEMHSFTAPEEPGKYTFLCTFPGHWFTMRGVMQVRPRGERLQAAQRETEKTATVPDALQTAGISHRPQGTLDKPLLMRTFLPDPGLDPAVFAHHGVGIPGFKYDPATRSDLSQKKQDPSTGKTAEIPQRVPTQPGIPGAIAVNHGESFSYAWDTTECRLLYAWRGGFLDMDPYWGREPGGGRANLYIPKLLGACRTYVCVLKSTLQNARYRVFIQI
jgi:azurin